MRHLGSVVVSLLLGPLVYGLTGVGLVKMSKVRADGIRNAQLSASVALTVLVAAGVLYAILVLTRLSPLGPVLVGLGYLGVTAWALLSVGTFHRAVPGTIAGVRGAGWEPAGAVMLLLAVPLLLTVVSPRRWRRYANRPAAAPATAYPGDDPYTAYSAAPAYQPMTYAAAPSAPSEAGGPVKAETLQLDPADRPNPAASANGPGPASPAAAPPSATQTWPVTEEPVDPDATRTINP